MINLNVVFTIDKRFLQHFCAALVSVLENNRNLCVSVYVVHDILDRIELEKVILFVKENYAVDICEIYVDNSAFAKYRVSLHYSKAVYYRLILTELLPEKVKSVLFLDADTIVNGSLQELANYQFEPGEYILAVKNISIEDNVQRLKKIGFPVTKYFNAGVLLINVAAWRISGASAKLMSLADKYMDKIDWWDQDILNIFFYDTWKEMDLKYNVLVYADKLPKIPIILHFAGREKPWLFVYDPPYKMLYWKYLKLSPYKTARYPDYSFKEAVRKYYIKLMNALNLREHRNNRKPISIYN